MNILFLFRKRPTDIGGLSRFIVELTRRFPAINWKKPIDFIHATDATLLPLGILLKLFFRVPLTVTAHGRDITWPNPMYQNVFSFCIPHVNAWIVDSPAAAQLLQKKGIKTIHVIPPGISIDHFNRRAPLRFPLFTGKTVLLTVGNLVPRKGYVWFIQNVLARLPSRFIYSIVGTGKEYRRIERVVMQRNLQHRVFLLGRLDDEQLASFLVNTHIYVAPNQKMKGDFEGFGIAAGEAAAMGLPVIASRVDGIPSVIHHNKNGLLVSANPNAWIKIIMSVESPNVRAAMGRRARQYTQSHFSWNKTIAEYSRLFQEVGGKRKSAPKRLHPR